MLTDLRYETLLLSSYSPDLLPIEDNFFKDPDTFWCPNAFRFIEIETAFKDFFGIKTFRVLAYRYMLHIDPWQSRMFQLCKQRDCWTHLCKEAEVAIVNQSQKNIALVLWGYICTGNSEQRSFTESSRWAPPRVTAVTVSHQSSLESQNGRRAPSGPWRRPVENISSKKKRCTALNLSLVQCDKEEKLSRSMSMAQRGEEEDKHQYSYV